MAIVEILLGTFALVGGVVHLLFGVGGLVSFSGSDVALGALADALGNLFTVEGLILIAVGLGLLRSARWAWTVGIIINAIGLVTSLVVLALGSAGAVVGLIVNVAALYYLTRSRVKAYLKPPVAMPSGPGGT